MFIKRGFLLILFLYLALPAAAKEPNTALLANADVARRLFLAENKISGLELVIAEGSGSAVYSNWGHAMLRFVGADGDVFNDFIVSMVANDSEDKNINFSEYAKKGLLGAYGVLPLVNHSASFWKNYVLMEGRPLKRYIIPSDDKIRHRLLLKLNSWIENPEIIGRYTFLSNNCAGVLVKLLEEAGLPRAQFLFRPRIPTSLPGWSAQSALSPFAPIVVDNYTALFLKTSQLLQLSPRDFISGHWPTDAKNLLITLNEKEIKQLNIVFGPHTLTRSTMTELMSKYTYSSGISLQEAMGFKSVPLDFYRICLNSACAQNLLQLEESFWDKKDLRAARKLRDYVYWLIFADRLSDSPQKMTFYENIESASKSLRSAPEYLINLQLLLREDRPVDNSEPPTPSS